MSQGDGGIVAGRRALSTDCRYRGRRLPAKMTGTDSNLSPGPFRRHPGERIMSLGVRDLSRREFLRTSAAGGFALGSLFGFGLDLRGAQEEARRLKIANAREVPSVCPYCAVG